MRKIGQARNTLMDMRLSQVMHHSILIANWIILKKARRFYSVFVGVSRCLTLWVDRQLLILKAISPISTPWSPHMEETSGTKCFTLISFISGLSVLHFLMSFCVCAVILRRPVSSWSQWEKQTLITRPPGLLLPVWRRWPGSCRWPETSSWKALRCVPRWGINGGGNGVQFFFFHSSFRGKRKFESS